MSCRSVPGMSVPMGLANIDSGLNDDQVQSLVHQLRHEYSQSHTVPGPDHGRLEPSPGPDLGSQGQWAEFRQGLATRVTAHPGLRPQRRAGLLRRIETAAQTPPADMLYAAERIRERAVRAARLMDDHLATEAARAGIPDVQAYTVYERGRGEAPAGRQTRATEEQRRAFAGLPLDPRTRYGLTALAAVPDSPDGRHELITEHPAPGSDATRIAGIGYHPDSFRLEVLTAEGDVLAYRDVPPALAMELQNGVDPDNAFSGSLLGNQAHQYRDSVQAAAAGVRRRCDQCGQFTGGNHNCLGRRGGIQVDALGAAHPLSPVPRQTVLLTGGVNAVDGQIQTYPLDYLVAGLERVRGEGVEFPIDTGHSEPAVRGSLVAALDNDDHLSVSSAHLMCTCNGYVPLRGCEHTNQVAIAMRNQLTEQLWVSRQQVADATAAAIRTRPATEQLLPEAPNLSTFSYTEDPERFAAHIRQVMGQPSADRVPFISSDTTPAMYGYGATREFGAELEFDINSDQQPMGAFPSTRA